MGYERKTHSTMKRISETFTALFQEFMDIHALMHDNARGSLSPLSGEK